MKKIYMKPTVEVVKIKSQANMLTISKVQTQGLGDDLHQGASGDAEEEGM